MRPVPHFPRVSCCTLLRQNPGNCTENPPSSRPCRGWPDCLAVGGVRSEPVSSPRCGYCPSSAARELAGFRETGLVGARLTAVRLGRSALGGGGVCRPLSTLASRMGLGRGLALTKPEWRSFQLTSAVVRTPGASANSATPALCYTYTTNGPSWHSRSGQKAPCPGFPPGPPQRSPTRARFDAEISQ